MIENGLLSLICASSGVSRVHSLCYWLKAQRGKPFSITPKKCLLVGKLARLESLVPSELNGDFRCQCLQIERGWIRRKIAPVKLLSHNKIWEIVHQQLCCKLIAFKQGQDYIMMQPKVGILNQTGKVASPYRYKNIRSKLPLQQETCLTHLL